jgi:hypothetical protein
MKLTSVTLTYARTVPVKDYENVRAEATATATIDPDDDLDDVMGSMWEMLRNNVRSTVLRVLRPGDGHDRDYLGMPPMRSIPGNDEEDEAELTAQPTPSGDLSPADTAASKE